MRYKINEINKHGFIQVPVELFTNELYSKLSNDARILYSFLLDRMELSRKNNWINENNEIYLIYPRKNIEKLLSISDKTCTKIFKQLREANLIDEERTGLNKPNKIYVNHIQYDSCSSPQPPKINEVEKSTTPEPENLQLHNRIFYTSGSVENTTPKPENLHKLA